MTDEPPIGFLFAVYTAGLDCPTCNGANLIVGQPSFKNGVMNVFKCPSCERLETYLDENFPHISEGKK